MEIGGSISGALFNDDSKRFRYSLWRVWEQSGDYLLFIGLNPSTANGIKDDPTIRRLINFAKSWDFGGLFCGNLFSLVTPDPAPLFLNSSPELPCGPNDQAIKRMRELSTLAIVGWGEWGANAGTRPAEVLSILGVPVFCVKVNKSGEPTHPLYLPADSKLMRYYRKPTKGGDC